MKISTKGRYGARAAVELATRYGEGPVQVGDIARTQGVSERYLEHILSVLRTAGLVASTRGARGGFELARPPAEITLGEVVRALEGPLDVVSCTGAGGCERMAGCATYAVWREVREAVGRVLDGVTLAELAERQRLLDDDRTFDYSI